MPGRRRYALALLTGLGALVPALAEPAAAREIDERLRACRHGGDAVCGGASGLELDLAGLRLYGAWRVAYGYRLATDHVVARPDWGGLLIEMEGLSGERVATVEQVAPTASKRSPRASSSPVDAPRTIPNHGIPIRIRASGRVHAELPTGMSVDIVDPHVHVDAAGRPRVRFDAELWRGDLSIRGMGIEAAPVDAAWTRLSLRGAVGIGDRAPTPMTGEVDRTAVRAQWLDGEGGVVVVNASTGVTGARVEARSFRLGVLADATPALRERFGLEIAGAELDGTLDIARVPGQGLRAHLQDMTLTGLVIDDARLSREAVAFEELAVSGDVHLGETTSFSAQVIIDHQGAQVHLAASRNAERTAFEARLAPLPCQDLLGALPSAMAGPVAGTRLAGSIEGRAALLLSNDELRDFQASDDPEAPHPGTLELDFPFLERCTVVADSPSIDLSALAGPYRHRFVDDRGRTHLRVLAAGAADFAPLSSIPLVANAFLTLEDSRFLQHDGFDREQIERALWHNLQVGRISRGASTITQQTARNLWLGVDRSLSRKLQEALLATRLEASVSKKRILELYLNIIELGPGIHGVEAAARYHFGKSAADLDPLQAVHLAMLAPGPRLYSQRFRDGAIDEAWKEELHLQVRRMHLHGHITREQLYQALRADLALVPHD